MPKTQDLKAQKSAAKAADRHNITSPAADAAAWARALTTKRVADLFKTERGLDGHWRQIQQEINRGNNHFVENNRTTDVGKKLIRFIADAIEKAAKAAKFDFPEQQLKFTADTGWLKISRQNGKVNVRSRP